LEIGITQKIPPLPWRERIEVRGKIEMFTPTHTLPRQGGGDIVVFSWLVGDKFIM
jgi:hypothetical protein